MTPEALPIPSSTPDLSVILITRNEALRLRDALASVSFSADDPPLQVERIVVDHGSTDGTAALARSLDCRVIETPDWPGFGPQKNRALEAARGRWVLSLDADERLTPELAAAVAKAVRADDGADGPAGFEFSRLSSFCGQWMRHGDWYPDRVLRLVRRGSARFTDDRVHERLEVRGRVSRLPGDLLHHTMDDLHDAIDKLNRYSSGRAQDMRQRGRRGGLRRALGHGAWAFVRAFLLKRGFLDGRLGFVLALYIAETTYYRYLKLGLALKPAPAPSDARL